jgi:hypothetical protein
VKTKLKTGLLLFVILFILPCVEINCGKRDQLVGTWQIFTGCGPANITFNNDGTGLLVSPTLTQTFKWRIDNDDLVIIDANGQEERMKCEVHDRTLTLTDHGTNKSTILQKSG